MNKTKYFLDSEFMEDGERIELLSLAIVCEDGRELYIENAEADLSHANSWVKENVIPQLWYVGKDNPPLDPWSGQLAKGGPLMRQGLQHFVRKFCDIRDNGKPEFWGYFSSYDWVAFCQLFGAMIDLPKGWPMYCNDIKQLCVSLGDPELPPQGKGEHHALLDARWNKKAYDFLKSIEDAEKLLGKGTMFIPTNPTPLLSPDKPDESNIRVSYTSGEP